MSQSIIKYYIDLHKTYEEKYGEKTVIFMMVGGFYELYSLDDEGPDLSKISEITNLVKTRKAKSKDIPTLKNPYMMGFNNAALEKFVRIMMDNGYYVIRIDQVTPAPNPKREVVAIYSPGTYLDSTNTETNNIVCIYIEDERHITTREYLSCIGLASVDLTTGKCIVYEVASRVNDKKYALDETYRFILTQTPKEILLIKGKCHLSKEFLIEYLELESCKNIHYFDKIPSTYSKISYQNEFLNKIYGSSFVSPIEDIDMAKIAYARISFIALLDFSYQHDENLINDLSKPEIFEDNAHLLIGNNAIYQLNILESNYDVGNSKIKSLYDVINHASTPMGKRYLKSILTQPICNVKELKLRYNSIDELLKDNLYKKVEKCLKSIPDIERLARKISVSCIQPYEFANLMESFSLVKEVYGLLIDAKYVSKYLPSKEIMASLDILIEDVNFQFNLDEMKMQNLNNITGSFFNEGKYPKIDSLHQKVVIMGENMEEICSVLSTYIEGKPDMIQLKRNNRDGYYLSLTKIRAETLKISLQKLDKIVINEKLQIPVDNLQFKELASGTTKIFIDNLCKSSNQTLVLKEKLIRLVKKTYSSVIATYKEDYKEVFQTIPNFIATIDFLKSNALNAVLYNYCKPNIKVDETKGFFKAVNLRHPIAERIRTDVEYIPHTISLGCDGLDGMLLFGLNSAGKSTLQKAIGISIIMAQCGMYVPAEKFEYSPYNNMFARISGNDNIFKGQSQFTLEMTELDAILKRNTPKTLVIGDEVCKGTEHKSATAIVAATIVMLAEKKCNFIFATHLHEVASLKIVKALPNVKTFHLSVNHDKEREVLVFDRILKSGSGRDDYGLTVAKFIIKDSKFIKLAQKIKNIASGKLNEMMSTKKSKYNKDLYVHECQICGLQNRDEQNIGYLDTHHINHQNACDKLGFVIGKSHLKKDELYNIVVLCKQCHYKAHHGILNIKGYKDTTNGRILDYETSQTIVEFN